MQQTTLEEDNKPTFLDLYTYYKFDIPNLANTTGIAQPTLRQMLSYQPVRKSIALTVLTSLSDQLRHTIYTLDNLDIPTIPTFGEVYDLHKDTISAKDLADNAGVTSDIPLMMIKGNPVYAPYAVRVLSALSALTQHDYTLETVEVNVLSIEEEKGSAVARLMRQIEMERTAGQRALTDFAEGNTRHEFINQRVDNIGKRTNELSELVGKEKSLALAIQAGFGE